MAWPIGPGGHRVSDVDKQSDRDTSLRIPRPSTRFLKYVRLRRAVKVAAASQQPLINVSCVSAASERVSLLFGS